MQHWENPSYQKIIDVKVINGELIVAFENRDKVKVSIDSIHPFKMDEIDWDNLYFNSFEIIIPAKPDNIIIPWDKIRVVSDKEFSQYLANAAEDQAKLIGVKIRRLREKKGIRSNELAERAGITPQTVSRIEKGHTDVGFSTLRKILASMGYSLKDLANQENELQLENEGKSFALLIRKLAKVGIDSNLLTRRIVPKYIQERISNTKNGQPELLLDEAASYLSNIYGWSIDEIWNSNSLTISREPAATAFFKKPSNANENQIKAYSHYAYYLAKIVLKGFTIKNKISYPESLEDFNSLYLKQYQALDLKTLLEFTWNMGICVLPLNDSGVFHGASWNIDGRHVIVVKQNTQSHARWIFDLLHELYHVFVHLDKTNTAVIEIEELNPFSNNDSIEELEANSFANQAIFGHRAEELAEKSVEAAGWKLENLKKAVIKIANLENIREDFLANYLAFRLGHQGQQWWSTAAKMQVTDPNPFSLASDFLKEKIQMKKLSPMDYNLLNTALTN
jgi:transcriptional regulator with XRE-family HTH domain